MSSLPPDFWDALNLLAKACEWYRRTAGREVVIVGGAAVSFYTQGQIMSGDFDMVGDLDFGEALQGEGFCKEDRPGHLHRGYYHPLLPRFGFELVSGALFDGKTDQDKITVISLSDGAEVQFPPIEDLIADRLGQYAASDDKDGEMLAQARLLMALAGKYDPDYLRRRVLEEGGNPALLG